MIVECLTDNKNRTATNIRVLFRKGQLGDERLGVVGLRARRAGRRDAARAAPIPRRPRSRPARRTSSPTARAAIRFYTEPTDLDAVSKALSARGWTVATMRLGWKRQEPGEARRRGRARRGRGVPRRDRRRRRRPAHLRRPAVGVSWERWSRTGPSSRGARRRPTTQPGEGEPATARVPPTARAPARPSSARRPRRRTRSPRPPPAWPGRTRRRGTPTSSRPAGPPRRRARCPAPPRRSTGATCRGCGCSTCSA